MLRSFLQIINENDSENIRCPFARIDDDELEIADFRIFANTEINEEQKSVQKLQERDYNEVCFFVT